ncbi:MAG TPA: hypothetical protein VNS55_06980 [Nocardioides sp.]|nr:hypothetical protein [Nocardioides sp.]
MKKLTSRLAICGLLAAATALTTTPAHAGDEVVNRGSCTDGTHWKMKAKPDDGRIEVEAEIDSNVTGQTWRWVLRHDGDVSARGTSQTRGASGSFSVARRTVDSPGTDHFRFRATHAGEVCVARVSL